jgi:hypothetical protein
MKYDAADFYSPQWNEKALRMLKNFAANIKAAILLIVNEDIAAIRTFAKQTADSFLRFIGRGQSEVWRNKKK